MKKPEKIGITLLVLFAAFNFLAPAFSQGANLKATKGGKRYHVSTCSVIKGKFHLLTFDTPEEAQAAGYSPCKKCDPPLKTK